MYPGFFPYLGHFDLANQADVYLIYDAGQYRRHRWINRNRILHPTSGWQYILLPLRHHPFDIRIHQVEIADEIDWRKNLYKQLDHYHMDGPYYRDVIELVRSCISNTNANFLEITTTIYRNICQYLGIHKPIPVFSEMNLEMEPVNGAENLALAICKAVGATEFINPPGGAGLYNPEVFEQNGIQLTIQSFTNMTYGCGRFQFQPALSILDVMMWNSPQSIKKHLDTHHISQETNLVKQENFCLTRQFDHAVS